MPRSARWHLLLGLLILGLFAIWTDRTVGWHATLHAWSRVSIAGMATSLVLLYGGYIARAERIGAGFADTADRFTCRLRVVLLHTFSNNFLPVRSGELAFPVLMHRLFGVPVSVSLPRLLWFRALDAHFLLACTFFAVTVNLAPISLIVVALAGWAALPLLAPAARQPIAARLNRRQGRLGWTLRQLVEGIPADNSTVLRTQMWTAVNGTLKMASLAILLREMSGLSLRTSLLGAIGGEASIILPLHGVAGAGTYEAGVLAVLTPLRVALAQALPAAVDLHMFILGACVLVALPALLPVWRERTAAGSSGGYPDSGASQDLL